ncbi:MAG TPA: excinuclease ABC subunit C, partial [Pasteurellaceae bacterium]|nr:excinuclease ABC subunit C [Pasteurellaceae bacterium]
QASQQLNFEEAARLRDQIQAVRSVIEKQFVSNERLDDMDIISIAYQLGIACVQVLFIRQGKILGNRSYFPKVPANTSIAELTETFVGQFYLQGNQGRTIPNSIIVDHSLKRKVELETLLSVVAGRKVSIQDNVKGNKSKYLQLAQMNAKAALITRLKQASLLEDRYLAL